MRRAVAVVFSLLAVAIFVAGVAGIDRGRTIQRELQPWPDGPEYVDAALELAFRGSYQIHVGGEFHPPRYPPGYSGVLALFILGGVRPVDSPYWVNLICGLLLLGLLHRFLIRFSGPIGAGLGALLLACLPAFSILCRSPMSDVAGACLSFGGVAALYLWGRGGLGTLGAWLLGLSVCFRISNVFLLPFVVAALAGRAGWDAREALRRGAALGSAWVGGTLLLLITNWSLFGSPFRTGYGYWLGEAPNQAFALENAVTYTVALVRELAQAERELNTASIYGSGSYFGPALVVLGVLGLAAVGKDRLNLSFLTAGLVSMAPLAFFEFADFRLLLPQLTMLCAVAAAGAERLVRKAWARGRRAAAAGLAVLTLAAVGGWPGTRSDFELGEAMDPRAMFLNVSDPDPVEELRRRFGGRSVLVLSDLPPPLVHALTSGKAVAGPLLDDHDYRFNPAVFSFGEARRRQAVEGALNEGIPALAVCARCRIEDLDSLASPPAGFRWRVLVHNKAGGGLARLERTVEPQTYK